MKNDADYLLMKAMDNIARLMSADVEYYKIEAETQGTMLVKEIEKYLRDRDE